LKTKASTTTRPATLADVARLAGIAAMTASRAINQSGYVSPEVRKRVAQAVKELNYRPNMVARQLRVRHLNAIGILLPDIANPFSAELVSGVRQVFDGAGYTTFIATTSGSIHNEKANLQSFVDHRVDGLIVATRGTKMGDEVLRDISRRGIPTATIGRPIKLASVDCVTANHWQGAFDAVTHLISIGHKNIGFIGISPEDRLSLRRYEGYAAALEQAGLEVNTEYIVGPPNAPAFATQEDGFEGMTKLSRLRRPPSAIFARNDFTAIGAMRAAHTMGMRVPADMAIAGFDNIPLAAFTTPPLTTVAQPIVEQGAAAAKFLLDRITAAKPKASQKILMECRLIIRGSTVPD
jgi:DNA-binding LacI/PurR family transcriptional regulator